MKSLLAASLLLLATRPALAAETWTIDPVHSEVGFRVRHFVSRTPGRFKDFSGSITRDPADPAKSSVAFSIKATSIDTANEKRDNHLRSADFFDVETYPELTFRSKQVVKTGGQGFQIVGDLNLHGVTREVVLGAELLGKGKDPWGQERIAFTAHTSVDRKDFGLRWNQLLEAGGVLVGEKVEIELEVQAIPAPVAAAVA